MTNGRKRMGRQREGRKEEGKGREGRGAERRVTPCASLNFRFLRFTKFMELYVWGKSYVTL